MTPNPTTQPDTGSDPLGDGQFRMYPSGAIVDRAERDRRLAHIHNRPAPSNDCLGKSWDEIETMQGGKLIR
jgi:hypothetical protein